jgi:50S ribosomal protein L16 3-hydroxylase
MTRIDIDAPTPLLGGLSPQRFMQRHWQKKPLLVRQALPMTTPLVGRSQLFALAARDDVESRLVVHGNRGWALRQGPFPRRALPPLSRAKWTLLVQGLDLHLDAAHMLMSRFRFVPDARIDDVMVSYATDGGGVGPHFDSYDVFLLQTHGTRRWRIGRLAQPELEPGVPLKILRNFVPEQEWLLEPGDMLYLPPRWAHDGVAEGECMTCSIGFRSAARAELAHELLQRMLDLDDAPQDDVRYRDPRQQATREPARIPPALGAFGAKAVARHQPTARSLSRSLGEVLSEPKPGVWFEAVDDFDAAQSLGGVHLDRRTRMLYDDAHVFINGESFDASGRDARLMRSLADARVLGAAQLAQLSPAARSLVTEWVGAGWLHALPAERQE